MKFMFELSKWRQMEARLVDENGHNVFELQQYKYVYMNVVEVIYFLLIGHCVSCVSDSSRVRAPRIHVRFLRQYGVERVKW